ncbi:MAG: ketoacyl-ACP synthase III [Armatimonadota bacterium]|nr:MAG: ketoacyl-ACP synthase III [Armatimonadota bacterium]
MTRDLRSVGIVGTGSYAPSRVLTNFDLEKMVDTSDEWIRTRTGIVERRIADPDVATSTLALAAAHAALESACVKPEDLDLIVVATVTPDMFFPCTASILQQSLGAAGATAFDILVGCTGFVYGLAAAGALLATGPYDRALVIGAETLSKITDWQDRSSCVLFGDAAGAAVLAPVADGRGILSYSLGNDGANADALKIPAGGSRMPSSEETVANRLHYLIMNGPEIFKFAVRSMAESSVEAVSRAGLSMSDIDIVIPHQANLRIIEAAAKRLNIPYDRFVGNLDRYGNTSAASIPLALDEVVRQRRIHPGNHLLLCSFGAGLSWGTMVLRW